MNSTTQCLSTYDMKFVNNASLAGRNIPSQFYWTILCCLLFAGVLLVSGCGDATRVPEEATPSAHGADEHGAEEAADSHDEHGHDEENAEIKLSAEAMREAGIRVEAVLKQGVSDMMTVPGRVVPTQRGSAHVGTTLPGRVTRIMVREGSVVRKGAPLAEIEAFDVGALKGELATARAEVVQTQAAMERQERLVKENIGARRSLEEARALYERALAARRSAEARLRAAGISPSSVKGQSFSSRILLRAPISGIVASSSVVLGEYLEANKDAFEIINTSTVWVDAQVSPDAASGLQVGGTGWIRTPSGKRGIGRIIFISPTLDPDSRTITVRLEVANAELDLRPETFVTTEFERGVSGFAVAVPQGAIEKEGDRYYVYREHEPNTFQRIEVEVGQTHDSRVVVLQGLAEGDRVVTEGVFYLRSARQQGELQEHHH